MLDKNWIRDFFKSIDYPIGTLSELYEDNQSTIEIVLEEIINPQDIPTEVPITYLHKLHSQKIFEIVDTRSNIQLVDLNYKPHGRKFSVILLTARLDSSSILH